MSSTIGTLVSVNINNLKLNDCLNIKRSIQSNFWCKRSMILHNVLPPNKDFCVGILGGNYFEIKYNGKINGEIGLN